MISLKCLIFGHKKYSPNVLNGKSFATLCDKLGSDLVSIDICERCGAVYSDLFLTSKYKTILERAFVFAKEKHEGQFRRDGTTPYFTHCEKVAFLVETDIEKAVAYCHDLIENNRATIVDIDKNVSKQVGSIVYSLLTRKKDQSYEDYIKRFHRVNQDKNYYIALNVKIADIVANLSDSHTQKQIEKYNKALRILIGTGRY